MKRIFLPSLILLITLACGLGKTSQASKPTVAIGSPSSETTYEVGQTIEIQAAIADSQGIARVELWIDGQEVNVDNLNPPATSHTGRHTWVPQIPGNHLIEIRAYNVGDITNEPAQVIVKVNESQPGPEEEPTATPPPPTEPPATEPPPTEPPATDAPPATVTAEPVEETPVPTVTLAPTDPPPATTSPEDPTPYIQPTPVIHTFTADRTTITPGEKVMLQWDASNLRAVFLRYNNRQERLPGHGTFPVTPNTTTHYELIARNDTGGEATSWLTIIVLEPTVAPTVPSTPVVEKFYAEPTTVPFGDCLTIYWNVLGNVNEIRLNNDAVSPSGSELFCPQHPTTYGFTLQISGQENYVEQTIEVEALEPPVLAQGTGTIPMASTLDVDQDGGIDFYRIGEGVGLKANEGPASDYESLDFSFCLDQVYHPDVPLGPYPGEASCLLTSRNMVGKFQVLDVEPNGVMTIEYTIWEYARAMD